MNRYKPVGWRGESHRHYLASKGIRKYKSKKEDVMSLEWWFSTKNPERIIPSENCVRNKNKLEAARKSLGKSKTKNVFFKSAVVKCE